MKLETALRRRRGPNSSFFRTAAVATVASACLLAAAGSSLASKPPPANASAGVIGHHVLYKPECQPVKGRRWNYPGDQKISSNLYEMFSINYPCAEAAKWTARLLRAQIKFKTGGTESVLNGPKGWYCTASSGKNGHPHEGQCSPTKADRFFGTGFSWGVVLQ